MPTLLAVLGKDGEMDCVGHLVSCDDAWQLGSIADPTLWLGGMSPFNLLITQVTWSPAFLPQASVMIRASHELKIQMAATPRLTARQ